MYSALVSLVFLDCLLVSDQKAFLGYEVVVDFLTFIFDYFVYNFVGCGIVIQSKLAFSSLKCTVCFHLIDIALLQIDESFILVNLVLIMISVKSPRLDQEN